MSFLPEAPFRQDERVHGQAEQQAPDPDASRSCCSQAAAMDSQDHSLPSAHFTTQMPQGTEREGMQAELTLNCWVLKMEIVLELSIILFYLFFLKHW